MTLNAIYNFGTKAYNSLTREKISSFMKTSLKIAAAISIPAIAMFALANLPKASAGPVTFSKCAEACSKMPPFSVPFCLLACVPTLGPWCP